MIVGYARTSTVEQEAGFEAQLKQLKAAGCEKVFAEQVSAVAATREQLEAALDFVREGDSLPNHGAITILMIQPVTCGGNITITKIMITTTITTTIMTMIMTTIITTAIMSTTNIMMTIMIMIMAIITTDIRKAVRPAS